MFRPSKPLGVAGLAAASNYVYGRSRRVQCEDKESPHWPYAPFWFKGMFCSHDVASVRRGYEVYRQVCAACHSMKWVKYRELVNQVYPEKRAKDIAKSFDVVDGPGDDGEMFERPGILTDSFPSPYPNDEAARYSNGGALPPDLSLYSCCKHDGADYIFHLLTGYRDPPFGIEAKAGVYYNTYMAGGFIAMPPPLTEDGQVEYEDGTPATVSQMAKDVCSFITWTTDPWHDERKAFGLKVIGMFTMGIACSGFIYRAAYAPIKTRRIDFTKVYL